MKFFKKEHYFQITPFILGFVTCLIVLLGLTFAYNEDKFFLREWQTLITGIFAIVAAVYTVRAMNNQTGKMEDIEQKRYQQQQNQIDDYQRELKEEKLKRSLVFKVKLPNELSGYMKYSRKMFFALWTHKNFPDKSNYKNLTKLIENHIEFITLKDAYSFKNFLTQNAVLHSRLERYQDFPEEDLIVRLLKVHTIAHTMFWYSRDDRPIMQDITKDSVMDTFDFWLESDEAKTEIYDPKTDNIYKSFQLNFDTRIQNVKDYILSDEKLV